MKQKKDNKSDCLKDHHLVSNLKLQKIHFPQINAMPLPRRQSTSYFSSKESSNEKYGWIAFEFDGQSGTTEASEGEFAGGETADDPDADADEDASSAEAGS